MICFAPLEGVIDGVKAHFLISVFYQSYNYSVIKIW